MNLINELGGPPLDTDTFLTLLDVLIDDFFQHEARAEAPRAGPRPALCRSEVLCLALFGRWGCFQSERAFWRYAQAHLRPYFPGLGERSRFNRLERRYGPDLQRLASCTPRGVITGFGVAPASSKDQPFAVAFFEAR